VVAPGIEPGISGSVARNSDHYTTEVVEDYLNRIKNGEEPQWNKDIKFCG
jgi:hypothetical protein